MRLARRLIVAATTRLMTMIKAQQQKVCIPVVEEHAGVFPSRKKKPSQITWNFGNGTQTGSTVHDERIYMHHPILHGIGLGILHRIGDLHFAVLS